MSTQTLPAEQTRLIISRDPATGEETGRTALMNADDVVASVQFARTAHPAWAALSYDERARYVLRARELVLADRKSTRLNSSHGYISYAVFCLKKKIKRLTFSINRPQPTRT